MQVQLSSPEITCEHCIATISRVAEAAPGVRFISGDPETKTFVVEIADGAALDLLGAALAAEDYPLGDVQAAGTAEYSGAVDGWSPAGYRIEKTSVGANVNYDCYCGCDAGFALDRSQADQAPESCCCGNHILVGTGAGERILGKIEDGARFRIDVRDVQMPWGQPLQVALAIPRTNA